MAMQTLGTRAFAVRCDLCGRSGPIVLAWRADDRPSRDSAVLEAIDDAIAVGFSISVSMEDATVCVMRCVCRLCHREDLPS